MVKGIWSLGLALLLAAGCSGTSGVGNEDSGTTSRDGGPADAGGGGDRDGGDRDGGTNRSDAAIRSDGGDAGRVNGDSGGGIACGPTTCASGEVCCNESCGICTPPDGSCIDLACVDAGTSGSDAGGSLSTCGGFVGAVCRDDEWCDYPDRSFCGGADGLGDCRARPSGCSRILDPVCGCDGMDYANECLAQSVGVDVASRGTCAGGDCAPMDAVSVGSCEPFRGYAWDGTSCEVISGCECVGDDCDSLYPDLDACMRAYASCGTTDGTFACGTMRCTAFSEYCQILTGGPAGGRLYACPELPDRCLAAGAPMCSACFPPSGPDDGTCTDGGPGEMTVERFAP